ncbi:hypothetical protein DL897_02970 [Thermoflavimicrobium daqui]|uniref:YkuS family protein n=1 Tax=Thermoflavimicrobium daqui TaxID=2137476 RepID=A0A364KA44_9BACL|nr:hypothetical protein DL897_02970 [Thermoflavimicrobium daqui]
MLKRIAVEADLSNVQQYLSQQGYQVEVWNSKNVNQAIQANFDAIVISGIDQNMMGMQDIVQNCPVINAHGLTAEEVGQRLKGLPS